LFELRTYGRKKSTARATAMTEPNATNRTTDTPAEASYGQTGTTTPEMTNTNQQPRRHRNKPQWLVENTYDGTEAKQIQELKKQIRASDHKAFIIKQDPGNPAYRPAWEVVTVDWNQSDLRLTRGPGNTSQYGPRKPLPPSKGPGLGKNGFNETWIYRNTA
jgi:hypothetical protein